MSQIFVTFPNGYTLTMQQVMTISRVGEELGEYEWHPNECSTEDEPCCYTVHPKGQHDQGYVVNADGDADWIDLSKKEAQ